MDDAWPNWLEALINLKYGKTCINPGNPRKFGYHRVVNYCQPGEGTNYWIDKIGEYRTDPNHALHYADMVIVESAVNDIDKNPARVAATTEILVRLLLALPNKPGLLYLGSSTRHFLSKPWTDPTVGNGVVAQWPVAEAYKIPYLSMAHGFSGLNTKEKRRWFLEDYIVDVCCHVTRLGHKLIAYNVFALLQAGGCTLKLSQSKQLAEMSKLQLEHVKTPSKPLFASQTQMNIYGSSNPFYINLGSTRPPQGYSIQSNGFESSMDVKEKLGFIATEVSSYASFVLPWAVVKKHCLRGMVKLEYLGSYEHMGTLRVSLSWLPDNAGCCLPFDCAIVQLVLLPHHATLTPVCPQRTLTVSSLHSSYIRMHAVPLCFGLPSIALSLLLYRTLTIVFTALGSLYCLCSPCTMTIVYYSRLTP